MMNNKFTIWLCVNAGKINNRDKFFRKKIFLSFIKNLLFTIANIIDGIVGFILQIKALSLWQDQRTASKYTINEFDNSLSMDTEILLHLNPFGKKRYRTDLIKRRRYVHLKTLGNLSPFEERELANLARELRIPD